MTRIGRLALGLAYLATLGLVGLLVLSTYVDAQIAAGTVNAKQSGTWTVQPGNTANSTAWLVTGTGGTFPTTPAALTSIVTGQQAVTSSATVLATQAGKALCLRVLIAGTQVVYYGPSGVTTGTGQELSPGDSSCMPLDNLNRLFVIAAGSGSTVAWHVLN